MSRKEIKITQGDYRRILLTEISPYETPFRFSYERLYNIWNDNSYSNDTKNLLLGKDEPSSKYSFVPYIYPIQKGSGETRDLGIIHPHLMRAFVSLYATFDELMLSLCSKSKWSLRKPAHVAKMYVPKFVFPEVFGELNTQTNSELGPEQVAVVQDAATSFFAYSPHNFLYKFFESRDLFDIERKFQFCKKLDIARCFPNIYTHSLSWAIKTKSEGKKEIDATQTFDAIFDSVIRRSNDNETHGILIGSEISRIFAEILLQQIDLETYQDCEKHLLIEGKHYTIRRYVDDYFVFYNEEVSLSLIVKALEKRLKNYKLFLNPSKESSSERPFVTDLSVCKSELRDAVFLHFQIKNKSSRGRASTLISKTRTIVKSHGISYSDCSVYLMSQLMAPLLEILEELNLNTATDLEESKICEILQIGFSLFSIETRFRSSFLLGEIMIAISRKYSVCNPVIRSGISDTIASEVRSLLLSFVDRADNKRLEICTLLTTMRGIPNLHPLPLDLVEAVCVPTQRDSVEMNYFLIVTLLEFLGCNSAYQPLQNRVLEIALEKIDGAKMPIKDCECFMMGMDLVACPLLNDVQRTKIISKVFRAMNNRAPTNSEVATFLADFAKGSIFFEWSSEIDSASLIAKKELAFTY